MSIPRVSIVVPCYNHAIYIGDRIDGLLGQTYKSFELILLDDASDDQSWEVISSYRAHPRVAWTERREQNSGSPYRQWASGMALAQGEYLWIAESDDEAPTDLLASLVATLDAYPDTAFVYACSIEIDEEGMQCGAAPDDWVGFPTSDARDGVTVVDGACFATTQLLHRNVIPNVSAVLFRTALLQEVIGKISSCRYLGDWLAYVQLCSHGAVARVENRLNRHRTHGTTTRTRRRSRADWAESFVERLLVLNEIERRFGLAAEEYADRVRCITNQAEIFMNLTERLQAASVAFPEDELYIYGAGALGRIIHQAISEALPEITVKGFIDRKAGARASASLFSLPVLPLERFVAEERGGRIIIASVAFEGEIRRELAAHGLEGRVVDLG